MKIAVFGLGYVGCVTAACFARQGHQVVGVDIQSEKVSALQQGISPIVEPGMDDLVRQGVENGLIQATTSSDEAIVESDIAIVCVGTPSHSNGDLNLTYVERVCSDIGHALRTHEGYFVIVIRSTMLPGSAHRLIPLVEEASGKTVGKDFGFCVNPEFLREGSAIADFEQPPFTVIGEYDDRSGDHLAELYRDLHAPLFRVELGVSELIKYASNAFHALKVVFANEMGNLCKSYGIDSHAVMDIFVQDTKLNLSPYYLKPGFAFGGSCLPKDLRALLYAARRKDISLPVLESILPSNNLQIEKALQMLQKEGKKKVALIGLSFKPQTDDLRESPAIELAERLIGKGYELSIYDQEVSLSKLHGSNRAFIDQVLPHIGSLLSRSLVETVQSSESIVVTKKLTPQEYATLREAMKPEHSLIDLVRLNGTRVLDFEGSYDGICW